MDYIIASVVFSLTFILFFKFVVPGLEQEDYSTIDSVYGDCRVIANALISAGYPSNWTNETVQRIGLTSEYNIINGTKVAMFKNMTVEDYQRVKDKFNLRADFVVFFINRSNQPVPVAGNYHIGHPTIALDVDNRVDLESFEYKNLASLTRVLVYNKTVVRMVIYTWN